MKRTLSLSVNLKIRLAVMSFLFMTASTPIPSASRMYSIFSTSAMVLGIPSFFAAAQARMFASDEPVSATNASKLRISSSMSTSEFRPSALITATLSPSVSESSRQRLLLLSMIFMTLTFPMIWRATISAVWLPPRIMTLFTSRFTVPMSFISICVPSRLEMM